MNNAMHTKKSNLAYIRKIYTILPLFYQIMEGIASDTTLFAPVIFFLGGVTIVILLNKFIGKGIKPTKKEAA